MNFSTTFFDTVFHNDTYLDAKHCVSTSATHLENNHQINLLILPQ